MKYFCLTLSLGLALILFQSDGNAVIEAVEFDTKKQEQRYYPPKYRLMKNNVRFF